MPDQQCDIDWLLHGPHLLPEQPGGAQQQQQPQHHAQPPLHSQAQQTDGQEAGDMLGGLDHQPRQQQQMEGPVPIPTPIVTLSFKAGKHVFSVSKGVGVTGVVRKLLASGQVDMAWPQQ